MKNIGVLICTVLLWIQVASSQGVVVSPALVPLITEYIQDANAHGINVASTINRIDTIMVGIPRIEGKKNAIGCVTKSAGGGVIVDIHPIVMQYRPMAQRVLYHELGHVMGMEHCHAMCDDIMSAHAQEKYMLPNTAWETDKQVYFLELIKHCVKK